jgi:hypothetical protein
VPLTTAATPIDSAYSAHESHVLSAHAHKPGMCTGKDRQSINTRDIALLAEAVGTGNHVINLAR